MISVWWILEFHSFLCLFSYTSSPFDGQNQEVWHWMALVTAVAAGPKVQTKTTTRNWDWNTSIDHSPQAAFWEPHSSISGWHFWRVAQCQACWRLSSKHNAGQFHGKKRNAYTWYGMVYWITRIHKLCGNGSGWLQEIRNPNSSVKVAPVNLARQFPSCWWKHVKPLVSGWSPIPVKSFWKEMSLIPSSLST